MNGLIALLGSGEYLPVMDEVDRYLLANSSADGRVPRVVCLPTAAGQEGNESVERWSRMGRDHFQHLGADVSATRVIDRASADDPQWETVLESADLIYFSGGSPMYLLETMKDSRAWAAAQRAWARGAAYAGCSAGAMILGQFVPDIRRMGLSNLKGFGILPARFIIPHFDSIPAVWRPFILALRQKLKNDEWMLGLDEDTALVGRLGGTWRVMGRQTVSVITKQNTQVYKSGDEVPLQTRKP
ncbi:MAG: Type 1 glutamine amidotransferase-like domain-containing protein [Chloroflexota bacterium]